MTSYRGSRLQDLLDGIRNEFENVKNEASNYRIHKDENDHKFNHHTSELAKIKQIVYELEKSHKNLRDSYDQEIFRLKKELEIKDKQLGAMKGRGGPPGHVMQGGPGPLAHVLSGPPPMAGGPPGGPPPYKYGGSPMPPGPVQAAESPRPPQLPTMYQQHTPQPSRSELAAAGGAVGHHLQGASTPQGVVGGAPQIAGGDSQEVAAQANVPSAVSGPGATSGPAPPQAAPQGTPQVAPAAPATPTRLQKEVPAFLTDLSAASVPDSAKKQTPDYYVLYNPQKAREIDVELVHSLDHSSVVCCVRFSADGKYVATGCNKTTQVYSVETGELIARLLDNNVPGESNGTASGDLYIRSVCFSPDGKTLATGAEDKLIRIWDLATRRIVKYLKGHEQDIYSLDFFPDGRKLISGSGDRTVRIWDLTSGLTQLTLTIEDGVTTVAVSPDGKLIAAGSLDKIVRVWDAVTGFLVGRLDSENEQGQGHKDSVYSVIFTGNGNEIASGSLDTTVKLWGLHNAENGAESAPAHCEMTFVGHKDFVLSVCASPNGEYILSGSKDRGVIFWDKKNGDPLLMLQGHRNSVISVNVSNNPVNGVGMFATGSGDCKARIWKWVNV